MTRLSILLLTFCIAVARSKPSERHEVRKFQEDFLFGTATASYQVEGAWNIDGYSAQWYEPESEEHEQAANDANDFMWAQYVHPIFSETGGYPQAMKERIASKSAQQGYPRSRLIDFTPDEMEFVKGSADAFGLNHYLTLMVYRNESIDTMYDSPSFHDDAGVALYTLPELQIGESQILQATPWGFYKLLTAIR
ncbi:unnamed protein product [Pieris brassicae]|uniref:Uncharacterized protein n=1 Tax=Pieris brassicae TaxID=7116 RepID=A0A9P0TY57_PIEBR|nr:unnamed protein product [Pieris brassicae]